MNYDNSDKIGNQFWKQRTKHGRDRIFNEPEILREAAETYFQWIDEHPIYKAEQKKGNTIIPKDSNLTDKQFDKVINPIAELPMIRPYTIEGLTLYLGVSVRYFDEFERSLDGKNDEKSLDFLTVLTYIKQTIRQSQFEGGAMGYFNPMIVSRLLGLKERTDVTTNDQEIQVANISFQSQPDKD
jgi:hypothetical protein